MDSNQNRLLWGLWTLLIAPAFVSCYESADENLDKALAQAKLKITTRSAGEIIYPLTVYAFDPLTEECWLQKTFNADAASAAQLELPEGRYRLVAMAGTAGCDVPSKPVLSGVVSMPDDNCLDHPLMQGGADLTVTGNASVDIMMYHSVASVSVVLSEVPADVASVDVTFSDFYQTLAFDGECGGSAPVTVSCLKNGDLWEAPVVYVLPGCGQKLLLTISLVAADGSRSDYGYTYQGAIAANRPYRFSGSYRGGFGVNGIIDVADWDTGEFVDFTFGVGEDDGDDTGGGSGDPGQGGTVAVSSLPVSETIWNGHFVALVQNADASGADVLLLSLSEWKGVPAEAQTAGVAQALADSYVEGGIGGWQIPVKEEVQAMKDAFGIRLSDINRTLVSAGGEVLTDSGEDAERNPVRYLCDGGMKTYTWEVRSASFTTPGTKRNYYLRAVKKLRMVVKDR